jgi:hypothetical protein
MTKCFMAYVSSAEIIENINLCVLSYKNYKIIFLAFVHRHISFSSSFDNNIYTPKAFILSYP